MKVGVKTNFGRLAKTFQICSMDADLLFEMVSLFLFISWILFVFSFGSMIPFCIQNKNKITTS